MREGHGLNLCLELKVLILEDQRLSHDFALASPVFQHCCQLEKLFEKLVVSMNCLKSATDTHAPLGDDTLTLFVHDLTDAKGTLDHELEMMLSEGNIDFGRLLDKVLAGVDIQASQDVFIDLTYTRNFPYWQIHHELKDLDVIIWKISLTIWLVQLRANFSEHLVASNTSTRSHAHFFKNTFSYK